MSFSPPQISLFLIFFVLSQIIHLTEAASGEGIVEGIAVGRVSIMEGVENDEDDEHENVTTCEACSRKFQIKHFGDHGPCPG